MGELLMLEESQGASTSRVFGVRGLFFPASVYHPQGDSRSLSLGHLGKLPNKHTQRAVTWCGG